MVDIEDKQNSDGVANQEEQKMNLDVEIKEVSSCERHVKVSISREEVSKYTEKEYAELSKTAVIPGFRVGKAPRKLLEKRFRKDVEGRVKSSLLLDSLSQISDSEEMTPISEPDINFDTVVIPDEGPFIYEYNIEVRPSFDLPNWKGLELKKQVRTFADTEVDEAVARIQENNSMLVDSTEPAKLDDYIEAKLTFTHEGKVLSKSENERILIRPTLSFHDCEIKDFDKKMVGAKLGDVVKIKVNLYENTANPSLSGAEVEATFEIKKVQNKIIPELDEEFLERMGGFSSIADLRDAVRDMLQRQFEYQQQSDTRRQIAQKLTAGADWELPPALLRKQADREMQRTMLELKRSGFDDRQIVSHQNQLRQNILKTTEQALKEHFIFEKIAEVEDIQDTPEDYELEINLIAAQNNESPRRIRSRLEKAGEMDILRNQIIERKVLELIKENATVTETPWEAEKPIDSEALNMAANPKAESEEETTEEA